MSKVGFWPDGPVCPHCGTIGRATRMKGKTTRRWPVELPRLPKAVHGADAPGLRSPVTSRCTSGFQAIYLMASSKKGISTRQLQRTFGGSMKTAWFLGHRVREAMTELGMDIPGPLGGANKVVESDELSSAARPRTGRAGFRRSPRFCPWSNATGASAASTSRMSLPKPCGRSSPRTLTAPVT